MRFAFDLISDLHVDSYPGEFEWWGQPTSQFCVVAGDVSQDHDRVREVLEHLAQCYRGVFYIDGNTEHQINYDALDFSYKNLIDTLSGNDAIVYLQNNLVVVNGIAILGTNGWWTWDFDPHADYHMSQQWFQEKTQTLPTTPGIIASMATTDAKYMINSVKRLQTHQDIKRIVMVTHTVPGSRFVDHDIDLAGTYRINCMGNSLVHQAVAVDYERKIQHWCFGHYHGSVDQTINGIRFVNNCRGKYRTPYSKAVFQPLRIEVDY